MSVAIRFEHVSKQYRLGEVGTGTLSHDLHRAWARLRGKADPFAKVGQVNDRTKAAGSERPQSRRIGFFTPNPPNAINHPDASSNYVWALKDINFDVKQGEILGIIGRNGAGKSTLLKLLSQVTAPTTGKIKAKGRIASLLEVGTGFHPELTGRENIYLNGAIMGMTRAAITKCLEEIVEFSGCAKYIDTPVKRYSSGMTVRLGFAVAAHLDCEIMVVDEVLAVGDAEFQEKCIGKMGQVSRDGRTVLIVSHQLRTIEKLCPMVTILDKGSLSFYGTTGEGLSRYLSKKRHDVTYWETNSESRYHDTFVPRKLFVTSDGVSPLEGPHPINERLMIVIEGEVKEIDPRLIVGIAVYNEAGATLFRSYNTDSEDIEQFKTGYLFLNCELPAYFLNEGIYRLELISGIHPIRWILPPEESTAIIHFEIRGGFREPSNWTTRRAGELAPMLRYSQRSTKSLVSTLDGESP